MKTKTPADSTLIRKIKKNGCNESYKLLCERHEKLFFKICSNYIPIAITKGFRREEVLSDKDFVIFKAISSYKNNKKCKFSTWLGNCTKYHMLSLINSNNKYVNSEEGFLEAVIDSNAKESYFEKSRHTNDKEYIFNILNALRDKRIAKVFELRFFDNYTEDSKPTWAFIAKKIDTSTQTAINLYHRGREILLKKIKSKEMHDMI